MRTSSATNMISFYSNWMAANEEAGKNLFPASLLAAVRVSWKMITLVAHIEQTMENTDSPT